MDVANRIGVDSMISCELHDCENDILMDLRVLIEL